MNNSIYSSAVFIGRELEINAFSKMLAAGDKVPWILHLYGPGGIGKTKLLQQFTEMVKQEQANGKSILFTYQLIDLYWTVNQQEIGLLKSIAEQLGEPYFEGFLTAVQAYERLLNHPAGPSPELIREKQSQAHAEFFKSYSRLSADQIFLFFDTAEVGGDTAERFWADILPQLKEKKPGTQIIIAGRKELKQLDQEHTLSLPVTPFSSTEVNNYFREHDLDIKPENVDRIADLSEGRPILIALSVDWLRYGLGEEKLVSCSTVRDFERLMIQQVQELLVPEDQVILAMAHFSRRFDDRFLAFILDESIEEARKLIETIAQFSFVKYRPPLDDQPGSCLLHDEMRDLIRRYVWPEIDPVGSHRREWNRKIVKFYETQINNEEHALERQYLELERLFYWLSYDLEQGFSYSQELFVHARKRRNTSLIEAINAELERVEEHMDPSMKDELLFRQALVLHGYGHFKDAAQKLEKLLEKSETNSLLQASVRSELIEVYVYDGELRKAVEKGFDWEKWFSDLLEHKDWEDNSRSHIEFEYSKFCNNLGEAFHNQNRLTTTLEYYRKALDHFDQVGDDAYAEIANTRNNLAFVYHRLGRDDEAIAQCNSAMMVRQRLNNPEQLGYSYNVKAMIFVDQLRQQEAIANFERAFDEFEKAGSHRGRGLVNIAYGRALRQLGRHIERNAQEPFDPNRQEYVRAEKMLKEAVNIFRHLEDEAYLSEALNEYGTLLRQQQKWDDAITCFLESKRLANKVNNLYREVDNLVDMAITYDYRGRTTDALKHAEEAKQIAIDKNQGIEAYNLFAKAQEVVANILFEQESYNEAFHAVADACIYIMRLDPEKLGESPAKRELYYNQMVTWASEKILQLPDQTLVNEKTRYLCQRWQEEQKGHERLADVYPGFIDRMINLARDYQFLKMNALEN